MDTSVRHGTLGVLSGCLAAFDFLSSGALPMAAERWNSALGDGLQGLDSHALTVAWANAGVSALVLGDAVAARQALLSAACALRDDIQNDAGGVLRGTSSGHHFRLAADNGDAFAQASTARDNDLRALIDKIIAHHLALIDGRAVEPREVMLAAMECMFGHSSIEAQLARAETLSDVAECYVSRANKLRALLRHWPVRGRLTPEVAIAAMAIVPFDPRRPSANSQIRDAFNGDV